MSTLREIVAAQTAVVEELPLVHTTRCEILPYIVANNELRSVRECDVFHEHLIYFFYGRPAYRHALGINSGGGIELCPVCFVFKPHTIGASLKRVYACDSGGIHYDKFAPHLGSADRDALQLEPTIQSARRLVSLVFGKNDSYYLGKAQADVPSDFSGCEPAVRFHKLLRDTGSLAADDRRSAIEIQMESPVPVGHSLLYIVLPSEFLNNDTVRRTIREVWQSDPVYYDVCVGTPANENTATIRNVLRQRFKEGGLL